MSKCHISISYLKDQKTALQPSLVPTQMTRKLDIPHSEGIHIIYEQTAHLEQYFIT